jgi:hypothetical protein
MYDSDLLFHLRVNFHVVIRATRYTVFIINSNISACEIFDSLTCPKDILVDYFIMYGSENPLVKTFFYDIFHVFMLKPAVNDVLGCLQLAEINLSSDLVI